MEYLLIEGDRKVIETEVNMYLNEGWVLVGSIAMVAAEGSKHYYSQAMTKRENR